MRTDDLANLSVFDQAGYADFAGTRVIADDRQVFGADLLKAGQQLERNAGIPKTANDDGGTVGDLFQRFKMG